MPPYVGSIHRRPRSDSGAARLWAWARHRRAPWTVAQAAEACDITARSGRKIVRALRDAGLVDLVVEAQSIGRDGCAPAEYRLSRAGRALPGAPIMIGDGERGEIVGVRMPGDGAGNAALASAVARSGLSIRAAALAMRLHERTLRRMLSGETPLSADDPVLTRAKRCRQYG